MALIVGDFVLVKEGFASSTLTAGINQVIQATSGNLTLLQSLITGGIAEQISSGPAKKYRALITQSGSNAPSATALRNDLSAAPTWARAGEGSYTCTKTGEFTQNKTFCRVVVVAYGSGNEAQSDIKWTSANVLTLSVRDYAGTPVDGWTAYVEIEVFV